MWALEEDGRQSRGTRRAVRMWVSFYPKGVHECVFAILLGLTRLISPLRAGNDVVVGGGAEMIARTAPIAALYVLELCLKQLILGANATLLYCPRMCAIAILVQDVEIIVTINSTTKRDDSLA